MKNRKMDVKMARSMEIQGKYGQKCKKIIILEMMDG